MHSHFNCLGEQMAYTQRMLTTYLRHRLQDTPLNPSQFILLLHLFKLDGQSQEQVNQMMQYDKGVIARNARHLEKAGYITRQVNPQDNRAYQLHLTPQAHAYFPEMKNILREWNAVMTDGEDPDDLQHFQALLHRITQRSMQKLNELKNK